jgi:hypothetical protein
MTAPLTASTKGKQHPVTQFFWSENVGGTEIHQRLSTQYGDSVLSQRIVYKWTEMFQNGQTSVTDAEHQTILAY